MTQRNPRQRQKQEITFGVEVAQDLYSIFLNSVISKTTKKKRERIWQKVSDINFQRKFFRELLQEEGVAEC